MKIYSTVLYSAIFILMFVASAAAQKQEMTFILLRHAEKDAAPGVNRVDPDLSADGKERAQRLIKVTEAYNPDQIFATVYKRARQTAAPLSEALRPGYRVQTQSYRPDRIEEFAAQLLNSNARTVVVVGHNNTTPELANILIKQEKYKQLAESEYDKIWIIKIKNGKVVEEKVITY